MNDEEFPPNSQASKDDFEGKNLEKVVSGTVVRKKRSLTKQLKETFIAGDIRSSSRYVTMDIILPTVRDMVWEAVSGGIEKLIFGESRRRGGSTVPSHGGSGPTPYYRYSQGPVGGASRMASGARALSRAARSRHQFDEIILESRGDAEDVIDRLMEVLSRFNEATVADLYELVGVQPTHQDHKWGWTNLRGAGVTRDRNGYVLDLPDPEPFG